MMKHKGFIFLSFFIILYFFDLNDLNDNSSYTPGSISVKLHRNVAWISTVCHSVCEFISIIWIKESDWLTIKTGRGILICSAWQGLNEPDHIFSCKTACAPSEDSDQPAHPRSLIRVIVWHTVRNQGSKTSSNGQPRLWPAYANAQDDLSLRLAHMLSCRKCCAPDRRSFILLSENKCCWHSFGARRF